MEKRSRRRTRDLVAQAASQGLSENEIGCARISMMARSKNAPFKGRIQKRKTLSLRCSFRLATHGRSIQKCHIQTSGPGLLGSHMGSAPRVQSAQPSTFACAQCRIAPKALGMALLRV